MKHRSKQSWKIWLVIFLLLAGIGFLLSQRPKPVEMQYTGAAWDEVDKGKPSFTKEEITDRAFESYSPLDKLGRAGEALCCLGPELMPEGPRGSIAGIKPTGFQQAKYPGVIDEDPPYLYNRCHLVAYRLSGENANVCNLITGTRYFNVSGMQPWESKVASYIERTGNHVMYRVRPDFHGKELVARGVEMEAYSVEDQGKGVSFHIYVYNVQPGIEIDYRTGHNRLE
ncbi:MAG: DNA/RNA non-specific endonuclease [Firmicutes bacterium]|nr:DNA/RNA non-specific endonuclease [Bacillota bacterium]